MAAIKAKWLTLTVAICFAVLQTLQPFIHAHLDVDHPIQHIGFHIGDTYEKVSHHSNYADEDALSSVPHISHTISVASAIKKDNDPALASDAIALILLSLCIMALRLVSSRFPPPQSTNAQSPKRLRPAPRAPPKP